MSLNPSKLLLGALTPFIAAGSALLVAAAAKYGIHLDPSGVNALGVTGATIGGAAMVKLIHDVESRVGVVKVAAEVTPGATEDAVAQASKALQEQFNTLVASLPQTSAPAPEPVPAPAPVVEVAPAPPAP